MITLIKAGGFYNIALVVFHLLFWRLFNWDEDLRSLSFINRATMQVMNLSLVVVFALFAYLSLVHSYELFATALGHAVLLSIAVLFLLRALLQVVFFRLRHWLSFLFLLFFLAGSVLYGIPALSAY